jgi:hypothetical protein
LVLLVNASWQSVSGTVRAGTIAERDSQFHDCLAGGQPFILKSTTMSESGIPATLPPWGSVVYRVVANRD